MRYEIESEKKYGYDHDDECRPWVLEKALPASS